MVNQRLRISLINVAGSFAFIAGITGIAGPYSIGNALLIFLFNLAMGYLTLIGFRYFEEKELNARRNDKPVGERMHVIALVVLTASAVVSLLYALFFLLLFTPTDYVAVAAYAILMLFTVGILLFYISLREKSRQLEQKQQSLSFILNSQKIMEIEILKYQIDPHFIFNAFNTLLFLINEEPSKAYIFAERLAKVYRYVIFSQHKNLVLLEEEIAFARDYAYLQEIRHEKELIVSFGRFNGAENSLILPVSIQILIENAIKHNEFSEENPLNITIDVDEQFVTVENPVREKKFNNVESSKIGLKNLFERAKLIANSECLIRQDAHTFQVFVPIIKTQA
jgi:sensor histidine kinase YesM